MPRPNTNVDFILRGNEQGKINYLYIFFMLSTYFSLYQNFILKKAEETKMLYIVLKRLIMSLRTRINIILYSIIESMV